MGITRHSLHKRRATGGKKVKVHKKRKYDMGRAPANTKLSNEQRTHEVRTRGGHTKYRALHLHTGNFSWPGEGTHQPPCRLPAAPAPLRTPRPSHAARRWRVFAQPRWLFLPLLFQRPEGAQDKGERGPGARGTRADRALALLPATTHKTRIVDVVYNASNNELVRTKTLVKGAVVVIDATPFRQWYAAHYGRELGKKENKGKVADQADLSGKSNRLVRKIQGREKDMLPNNPQFFDQFMSGRLMARVSSRPGQSGRCDGYILEGKELDFYVRKLRERRAS